MIRGSFDRDEFHCASEAEWEAMVEAKRVELEQRFGRGTLTTDDEQTDGLTWRYVVDPPAVVWPTTTTS